MKIALGTVDERRAVRGRYNVGSLESCPVATRDDVRQYLLQEGSGGMEQLYYAWLNALDAC